MNQEISPISPHSEELLQLIVRTLQDFAIFATDVEGRIVSWNPGVKHLLGYDEAEFIGQHGSLIFTPEDLERGASVEEMKTAASEGRAEDARWHVRKDGSRLWANGFLLALRDGAGGLRGFAKVMRDDTARKRAEEALQESEERRRLALESAELGAWHIDPVSMALTTDDKFRAIFGVTSERLDFEEVMALIHPDDQARVREAVAAAIRPDDPASYAVEHRVVHPDGAVHWVFAKGRASVGQLGQTERPLSFDGTIADITERKRAEVERERLLQSLEVERMRLKDIFMKAPAFVNTSRGPEHVFELVNPALLQLVGHRELVGKSVREAFPELEGQGYFELLDQVFQTGVPYEGREMPALLQREPGAPLEERFIDLLYQPLFEADGTVSGIFTHGVDITEQVVARKKAEEANQLKDEFLATFSHEMRTPLTAILGWAWMLRSGVIQGEGVEGVLDVIVRNAQAQSALIDDILDVSRISTGKLRLELHPVDISAIVTSAVDTVRPAAEAKSVDLQVSLDPSAGQVSGDADRLRQVLWNLLSNAVKFTPKGERVQVKLLRVDSRIEIIVSDTGQGIMPEFLPHVFDRFRQADQTTKREHGGLGLGLALVRQLVELHGGKVTAASEGEGRGSSFTVTLPRLTTHGAEETAETAPVSCRAAFGGSLAFEGPPYLDALRVLVVDDEADARNLLRALLERCGAEVTTAASAPEAMAAVVARMPELLISDIGMPGEDGYALIGKIRAYEAENDKARIPAIALTAYTRVEDRVRALQAGFQVHMPKPIEPTELVAFVASLTGRK